MKAIRKILLYGIQIIIIGCVLLPVILMFTKVSPQHFFVLLIEKFWFYPKFWFSLLLAAAIGAGAAAVALFAAIGLKTGRVRFKTGILFLLLLLMLMPQQTTLLPNYIGLRDLKLLDTPWALMFPMLVSPFAIYLMYQYMDSVPLEGLEAARLETTSVLRMITAVMIPQLRGCIAAVFVFMFAEGFNMVEQPLYFVKKDALKPLSVLTESMAKEDAYLIYAVGILCMCPMLLLYGFYEEELADGLGRLRG